MCPVTAHCSLVNRLLTQPSKMRTSKLILSSAALAMGLIATAPKSQAQG